MGEVIAEALGRDLKDCAVYAREGVTGERDLQHRLCHHSVVATSWATTPCCLRALASASGHAQVLQPRHVCAGRLARRCAFWRPTRPACSTCSTCSTSRTDAGPRHGRPSLVAPGDAVTQGAAVVLLAMSVASWVVIALEGAFGAARGRRCGALHGRCLAVALARCGRPAAGRAGPQALVAPLVAARWRWFSPTRPCGPTLLRRAFVATAHACCAMPAWGAGPPANTGMGAAGHRGRHRPFVGLLGTVWGIYHALTALGGVAGHH